MNATVSFSLTQDSIIRLFITSGAVGAIYTIATNPTTTLPYHFTYTAIIAIAVVAGITLRASSQTPASLNTVYDGYIDDFIAYQPRLNRGRRNPRNLPNRQGHNHNHNLRPRNNIIVNNPNGANIVD